MDKLEKVEKIIEKTGVSYEDAKIALENSNEDILDAICYLERMGKINKGQTAFYTVEKGENKTDEQFARAQANYENSVKDEKFSDVFSSLCRWCKKVLDKSFEVCLLVKKHDREIAKIPVFFLVLLLIFAFWVVIPLMIIGLFFEIRYSFVGIGKVSVDVNEMCDKCADKVDDLKNKINN
ncbi:hypothetical protein [Lachnospira multipara]|uniref:hypothetical protein n=1 Tax=Lachnospira multipara TaxID=28051 RepID=UPI0004E19479|nr:hypothetical protein [Lachnospira multipara]